MNLKEMMARAREREMFFRNEMIDALDKQDWERFEWLMSLRGE